MVVSAVIAVTIVLGGRVSSSVTVETTTSRVLVDKSGSGCDKMLHEGADVRLNEPERQCLRAGAHLAVETVNCGLGFVVADTVLAVANAQAASQPRSHGHLRVRHRAGYPQWPKPWSAEVAG